MIDDVQGRIAALRRAPSLGLRAGQSASARAEDEGQAYLVDRRKRHGPTPFFSTEAAETGD